MSVVLGVPVRRALAALAVALCALLVLTGTAAATVTQAHTESADTTQTSANLHAFVSSDTGSLTYHFDYGTTTTYGASTAESAPGSGGQVSQPIGSLSPSTPYYFRVVVTDSAGTVTDTPTAPNGTFTTASPPPPPTYPPLTVTPATTSPSGDTAQDPRTTGFTVQGIVQGGGPPQAVSYHFEYGPTTAYGHSTPSGSATTPATVSAQLAYLNDLPQSGTYHVRLVVIDASNVTHAGDDSTFVVQPPCPSSEFSVLGVTRVGKKVTVALQFAAGGELDQAVPAPPQNYFPVGSSEGINPVSQAGTFRISGYLNEDQYFTLDVLNTPLKVVIPFGFSSRLYPEDQTTNRNDCVQDGLLNPGGVPVYHVVKATLPAPRPGGPVVEGQGSIPAGVAKALVPGGKAATVAAILKAGGYPAAVTSPGPGTVQISWYYVPAGAHVARTGGAKAILIASGSEKVVKAGKTTLKVKLTTHGRAMFMKVKRGHTLKLTAKGSFTPTGGQKTIKRKAFSIKR